MQDQQKRRSTLALYISRRTRREWLNYDAHTLATLTLELPGKRLAVRVGSWRTRHNATAKRRAGEK